MQIKFLFEMEDWMALQEHFLKESKVLKYSQWLAYGLIVASVGTSFVRTVLEGQHQPLTYVITGTLMALILLGVFYLFRWLFGKITLLLTRRMLKDGNNEGLLGEHLLTFDDEGIHALLPEAETKIKWSGYKKFAETPDHYLLYNTTASATVIPKVKIEAQKAELDALLQEKLTHLKTT